MTSITDKQMNNIELFINESISHQSHLVEKVRATQIDVNLFFGGLCFIYAHKTLLNFKFYSNEFTAGALKFQLN